MPPLPAGTAIRVQSAVLGTFSDKISGHFMKDGKLCYTLGSRRWIYATEINQVFE